MDASKIFSYLLLICFSIVPSIFLVRPYLNDSLSGSNSMAGLAQMIVGPFLGIISSVVVIWMYYILVTRFKLALVHKNAILLIPLILTGVTANFWLFKEVILLLLDSVGLLK